MRGVPLPERLVKKRMQAVAAPMLKDLPKEWQADISKVEACSLAEYDEGRGLKTIFPQEDTPKKRCFMICAGDTKELKISLELVERHQDPHPSIICRFDLPDDDERIGIRLYDVNVSIEIREHPRDPKQRKSMRRAEFASGSCWVFHLETSLNEQVLKRAKTMLRRLESVTNAMPSEWFAHRNYFVKRTPGDETAADSTVDIGNGVFTQTFVGGYAWRFTGNLASTEFQDALAGKLADEESREEAPTRVQPPRTAKGKKAAKNAPRKQRRLKRVEQRSMAAESSQNTPEAMIEQEDEIEQPELSSPAAFSSESEVGDQSEEPNPPQWAIEGLLDKRTRNCEVEYEVQWTGPYRPTWEPAANVSAESIAEFDKNHAIKAKKSRGRPRKAKQAEASSSAPTTRSAGKKAKESAK